MKLVKISAMWCMSCIIMNNLLDDVLSKYNVLFDIEDIDYDMDSSLVSLYDVGSVLPVYILMDSSLEVARLVGEVSESSLISFLKDNGGIDEVQKVYIFIYNSFSYVYTNLCIWNGFLFC